MVACGQAGANGAGRGLVAIRRQVESLAAQAEFQRFQLEATYLTLTSNVVAAAVQEASLRGQIAATEEIIRIETEALGILRRQFELGQVAGAEVATVEATFGAGAGDIAAIAEAIGGAAQSADRSDRPVAESGAGREVRSRLAAIAAGSAGQVLPSKLVDQRPDVRSAEAQLHSASAQIGVAIANQLPQFTLTANAGAAANQIGQLFMTPGTAFWSVAGNVAQTIFDAGTLLHRRRAPKPPSTRRQHCTAARLSSPFRTSQTHCARCRPTPTR